MYEQFFGLKEKPFSLTPDTEYFYRYSGHQEALNVLLVALRNGEGFVRVVGEVGTGKTLLCRQMLRILQDDCETVYLPNPLLTQLELYQAIASELQLDVPAAATVQHLNQHILEALIRLREQDRPLVVLIDEAQAMPFESLEALRLLSNIETEKEKLLHIFFFAQPEFEERLAERQLRQLQQRITFSYCLPPLNEEETAGYLQHRLQVAGHPDGLLFKPTAASLLHKESRGYPRLINLLAHKAMLAAYGKGRKKIDRRLVQMAIDDSRNKKNFLAGGRALSMVLEVGTVLSVAAVTLFLLKVLL
ncbi:MSHA biogenesis protein MshM [Malonomonas rubra DSM 5091]|uniref:MSHA biogenesis protein MshM n=1 Tax=Malonomonas rubra DSM 5091 TaxID=1122189 RepID=A0A1M6M5P5_MALRU|nr:AAA family ATPase [Malonomonas rubra]SHJ78824.1 MSHA biogenesis protein MshM [Malonomonas rubra DSM 5091]